MYVHEEHGSYVDKLDVEELHRVDGSHREGSGLLVGVVQLVEVLVQEGHVVDPGGGRHHSAAEDGDDGDDYDDADDNTNGDDAKCINILELA